MRIIPAIDLKEGQCVRLFKGDFEQTTIYSNNPLEIARQFFELKVRDLHVVDLDGARTGEQNNADIVSQIAAETELDVQLGGGIRDADTLQRWFDAGVSRCVIGSLAVSEPALVKQWMEAAGPERLVLALDINLDDDGTPMLTTHGWTRNSGVSLWQALDNFGEAGLIHVLCTDVSRDGAMAGPNQDLYVDILQRYPGLQLQASGGVRSIDDLRQLRAAGIPAAISGKAMLDGAITQDEVASFQQSA